MNSESPHIRPEVALLLQHHGVHSVVSQAEGQAQTDGARANDDDTTRHSKLFGKLYRSPS